MRKLSILLLLCVFSVSVLSATKTISLTPSRSGEQINLQEDFLEYYTTYERRTSNEYGCLPEQVIRPICRTLPPRTECGPRQWCTPTYYGPVCQTRVICGPVAGGQYCENIPVTENICRTRTITREVPVQRSRVLYTTQANVRVELDERFPQGNFDLIVDLTQDRLTYTGNDFSSEYALRYSRAYQVSRITGELNETVEIEAIHTLDYYNIASQIPALEFFDRSNLHFKLASNTYNLPLTFKLRLVNRYGQVLENYVPGNFMHYQGDSLRIDTRFLVGPYFYPVAGELTITASPGDNLLNKQQFFSQSVQTRFSL
jgi:hypothetical protein